MFVEDRKTLNKNYSVNRFSFETPEKRLPNKRFEYSSCFKDLRNYSNMSKVEEEKKLRTPLG